MLSGKSRAVLALMRITVRSVSNDTPIFYLSSTIWERILLHPCLHIKKLRLKKSKSFLRSHQQETEETGL